MAVTVIVTDDLRRKVITEVLKQWFAFKPQEAREYFRGVKRFHDSLGELSTKQALADKGTLLYCAKIPAEVLRNIELNIPDFMANGDARKDKRDLALFFEVASEAVFRPRASGISVPEKARVICHRSQ